MHERKEKKRRAWRCSRDEGKMGNGAQFKERVGMLSDSVQFIPVRFGSVQLGSLPPKLPISHWIRAVLREESGFF